jgi:hypothetical protein
MQQNLPKSAQNCLKLPQTAKICPKRINSKNFEIHQKLRFWYFSTKKKLPCVGGIPKHVHTVWIFDIWIFHMPFLCQKTTFVCEFQHTPLYRMTFCIRQGSKVPYVLWIWDFVDMYLINLEIRIWSPLIHTYFKKWFFWPPKLCCTPWTQWKELFLPTLNLMILQIILNECVRFGGAWWAAQATW